MSFSLTPNPARTHVVLGLPDGTEYAIVSIYSVLGYEVLRKHVYESETRISLGDLPVGVYMIALTTDQGIGIQRLVVEH